MTDEGTQQRTEQATTDALTDPDELRDRDDVVVEETERPMPDEKYEALRERYDAIAGVVQVGLRNDDGDVLFWGDEEYAPPGGSVDAGGDWVAAARDAMEHLTGRDVRVDDPVMLEVTYFHREGDAEDRFPAPSVLFTASLAADDPAFYADPEPADDFDHPMFEDSPNLGWFGEVTDEVDENHAHHLEAFLD